MFPLLFEKYGYSPDIRRRDLQFSARESKLVKIHTHACLRRWWFDECVRLCVCVCMCLCVFFVLSFPDNKSIAKRINGNCFRWYQNIIHYVIKLLLRNKNKICIIPYLYCLHNFVLHLDWNLTGILMHGTVVYTGCLLFMKNCVFSQFTATPPSPTSL